MFFIDFLELFLSGLVQLYQSLLGHTETWRFDTFVGLSHQNIRISGFIQVRMMCDMVSQVCDVIDH